MAISKGGKVAKAKRTKLREEFWPNAIIWEGPNETGFFCAPRTLPIILCVLRQEKISGKLDPSSVYLELYSKHMGEGIIEMLHDEDHANAAGYFETRAIRSWRDRMKILEDAGFIKSKPKGSRKYGYVILVHPSIAMAELRSKDLVPDELWTAYISRQVEYGEYTKEELEKNMDQQGQ